MSYLFNKIFSKNKDFPWQTMSDETIIIDPKGQNSFELNELGSFIWVRIDGKNSVNEISNFICQQYEVDPEVVNEDLMAVVGEMQKNKLIVEA